VLQIGRSLVRSQLVSLEFFNDIKSFRSHYGPGVDSASNRNEYQEYFLVGKGGRCVRLTTLPPSCAAVTKSGNLNSWNPLGHSRRVTGLIYLSLFSPCNYGYSKLLNVMCTVNCLSCFLMVILDSHVSLNDGDTF